MRWPERAPLNWKKFFTQDNADFVAAFIQGAKKYHGLDINYCGIWNETLHDSAWIKLLRKTLNNRGLAGVQIVACDECDKVGSGKSDSINGRGKWDIVNEFRQDDELNKAVQVVGAHYPGYQSTAAAKLCGKPLWSSEDNPQWKPSANEFGTLTGWAPAPASTKMYNRNYIDGRMTKTVTCYLIDSYYDSLTLPDHGPMKANTPWSGHYEVWPALWAMAHTGQFAQPGWKYLDGACGLLKNGGSYVCLRSPQSPGDYSIIIETSGAKRPQTLSFRVTGGLAAGPVHVWRSNAQSQFVRQDDLRLADGSFSIRLEPGCIYSLTTTAGQQKGKAEIPPAADFPRTYEDDFEGYAAGKMPKYFADQAGVFEVAERPDGGKCLRQTVARRGIDWRFYPNPDPYTIIGGTKWRNYEVSCDAYVEKSGYSRCSDALPRVCRISPSRSRHTAIG